MQVEHGVIAPIASILLENMFKLSSVVTSDSQELDGWSSSGRRQELPGNVFQKKLQEPA